MKLSVEFVWINLWLDYLKYDLGTKVTLIGENNGKVITAQDVANYADTIHYEIMCNITERVPRIYK